MKYYLFNAKTNDFILKCTEKEMEVFRQVYKIEREQYDTGCDAYGNEFNYVSAFIIF